MPNPGMKTCPECAEEIKLEAKVCRFCGTTFSLVEVGYCVHCHKVTATSDLGVCAVCSSRLIDVHAESVEISGPRIGPIGQAQRSGSLAPAAEAAGWVTQVAGRDAAPGDKESETADTVLEESGAEPESEAEEGAEPEGEEAATEPAFAPSPFAPVSLLPGSEKTPEPESALQEPDASEKLEEPSREQTEAELPPPPPAPGPPSDVISWARRGSTFEPVTKPEEPVAPAGEPDAERPEPVEEPQDVEEKPVQPVAPSSDVAERLAAFGRRTPSSVQPPASPPLPPPPSPPAVTPSTSIALPPSEREAVASRPEAVSVKTEEHPLMAEAAKGAETVAAEPAGERFGIVPSLAHRIAFPLYQLAAVVVVVIWLVELYWNHSLKGTDQAGSKALAHLAVATYGSGHTLLIGVQIGVVAIICGLLAPTRVLPRGWFRRRAVAKEFTRDLQAQLGVKMIFQRRWYLERMFLAFAIWAIALAYFVWGIARKTSVDLQVGGYLTTAAILVGFACSAVLMMRRTPVVGIDENGKIRS